MRAANIFGQKHKITGLNKKPVIKGEFSSYKINNKELRIFKLNKFMGMCLLITVFISMVVYIAVISQENIVKKLHTETTALFYENIDLQNRVDNLKSFYSIDNKVSSVHFLKKADKIIEVNNVNKPVKTNQTLRKNNLKQVPAGF